MVYALQARIQGQIRWTGTPYNSTTVSPNSLTDALQYDKNISKKEATFARIYLIIQKTQKNLTENELENVIDNVVDKTIIGFHQQNKSYTVPDFTYDTFLGEQTQDTDEDATQTRSQDNENLNEKTQLQDRSYNVIKLLKNT